MLVNSLRLWERVSHGCGAAGHLGEGEGKGEGVGEGEGEGEGEG